MARDGRIPKPLRWLAAIGLLPIPGPIDEAVLLLVALLLYLFYREPLIEAWQTAEASSFARPPRRLALAREATSGARMLTIC